MQWLTTKLSLASYKAYNLVLGDTDIFFHDKYRAKVSRYLILSRYLSIIIRGVGKEKTGQPLPSPLPRKFPCRKIFSGFLVNASLLLCVQLVGLHSQTPHAVANPGFAKRGIAASAQIASLNGGLGVESPAGSREAFCPFSYKKWPKVKDLGKSAHYSRQSQMLQKCLKPGELVLLCMFQIKTCPHV